MEFDWDPRKARINARKHGITFEEAATVFNDILSFIYDDEEHSQAENRYATLGMSERKRILVVAHAIRGDQIRIISARKATARERNWYEEENK
jgi:uncharacterized protein